MAEPSKPNGKVALIITSDTHTNHVYGLGPPTFTRQDGDTIKANPIRRELWKLWNQFWDKAFEITEGYTRVAVALGDIIENDAKVRSQQDLVTLSPPDALTMVCDVWEPIANEVDHLMIIRGTEAHVGQGAWLEEAVARNFDNVIPDEEHGNASWWHFWGEFGGVSFDLAHHASMGSVHRNKAAAAGRLAYDIERSYIVDRKQPAPQLAIRAHNHRWADSGRTYSTRAVMIGCFQFKSTFLHRINKAYEHPNLGGLVVLCDGGRYQLEPIRVTPKAKKIWRMKST